MNLERLNEVNPFFVMEVLEKANELERAGKTIIHLEIGEPDFDTPEKIRRAGMEAIQRGRTHYTHSLGIYPLRQAICDWYYHQYNVSIEPDRVVVTMGTSPGLLLALSVLVSEGDEVILSDPGYACYPNFIRYLGAVPVFVAVPEENGFQYEPAAVKKAITRRTKAILINSPANPTGNLLSTQTMEELVALEIPLISDEIYHGLVYEGKAHSILEFTDRAIVLNGFSKLFAMTGWRLGYLILPRELVRPVQKLQQNFFISPSAFAQEAGVVALTEEHPELQKMVQTYNDRRKEMIKLLRQIGFGVTVEPTGAFYIFANARRFTSNSLEFSFELLENAGVAVAPGIDFGPNGEGYLRFSYANSLENIREGCRRIAAYLSAK